MICSSTTRHQHGWKGWYTHEQLARPKGERVRVPRECEARSRSDQLTTIGQVGMRGWKEGGNELERYTSTDRLLYTSMSTDTSASGTS